MKHVDTTEAKSQWSALIEMAAAGEEIVISRYGKPVARLLGITQRRERREFGRLKGKIEIREGFDDPLPADIARAFGMDAE
ncbi:MAG: type II toxin-antitoxin system prevent-host-death family antitoxin [Phycisphaeraceae bacterium]